MKNIVIIDIDDEREQQLQMGKPRDAVIDTGNMPQYMADLNTCLNGLLVTMRQAENAGVKISVLIPNVIKVIETGMFDAKLNPTECKEK